MKDASSMIWDYVVFILFVVASTFVAVYSRFFGSKEKTKADYVFAVGRVSMGAMMLSIARGILGVRTLLGFPSELFYRGTGMWETLYGMLLAYPIISYVFVPVYLSLGITSVYQYLDLRFKSRLVRCLSSGSYIVRQLLNQAVTVFTPCVALSTVVGIPYWASISGITALSVIFTVLGGLKAAIQADVMQGLTMVAVCLVFIIKGFIDAGGVGPVFEKNSQGGRFDFLNFDLDPTIRVATTSALVGQLFMSLSIFGCQQNFVQRYISMGTEKQVRKTLMYNMPVITVLFTMPWIVGLAIYATYADCDPMSSGYIEKYDEILPFYVEDKFSSIPGILGLFMASLFNGAFSLNVSIINSLATVTFEDFVRPIPALKGMSDKHQLNSIKAIGVIYGFVIMGAAFLVGLLDGVIEFSMLVTSATSGPLLGVFIMAMLIPCCNWKGASLGMIAGHAITLWITWGGLTIDKPPKILPLSTDGCTNDTFSISIFTSEHSWDKSPEANITTSAADQTDFLTQLYSITYMYYAIIGTFITVAVGWIISYFTSNESDVYDEKLIHPGARKIASLFPGKKRRYVEKISISEDTTSDSTLTSLESIDERKKDVSAEGEHVDFK